MSKKNLCILMASFLIGIAQSGNTAYADCECFCWTRTYGKMSLGTSWTSFGCKSRCNAQTIWGGGNDGYCCQNENHSCESGPDKAIAPKDKTNKKATQQNTPQPKTENKMSH